MKIALTTFLFALIVSHFSFGQLKIEDLKIDTEITGFQLASETSGTSIYTPNGKSDLGTMNPSAFSFTIVPNTNYKSALKEVESLLLMSEQNGYIISDIVKKDTIVNGCRTHIISYTENQNGTDYHNQVFNATIIKDETAIIFLSGDLSKGKYIENFKKTLFAVEIE